VKWLKFNRCSPFLWDLKKISFKHLVLGIAGLTFILLTTLTAFYSSFNAANELTKAVYQQGVRLSHNLAINSVVPLLYESDADAEDMLQTLLGIQNVTEVSVMTSDKKILLSRKLDLHIDHFYPEVSLIEPFNVIETDMAWYYSVVVLTPKESADSVEGLYAMEGDESADEVLGYVRLSLSKHNIASAQRTVFINNFIVSLVIGGLLLIIMYLILRAITRPLEKLSGLMEQGQRGIYSESTDAHGPKEIFEISSSYNNMINAIDEREQNLSLTMDSIAEGVIVSDNVGNVTRINPAAEKFLGRLHQEVVGKYIDEVLLLENVETNIRVQEPLCEAIKTAAPIVFNHAVNIISASHKKRLVMCSVAPIVNPSKHSVTGAVLIISDITEKNKQDNQLRRSQKMEALGKLTGGIAHDYNNMLGIVMGYAEFLQNALADQPKLLDYAQQIYHASERGAKLTGKLMAFSRYHASGKERFNINHLLQDEQNMLEKILTVRINLKMDLAIDLWSVYLDSGDFEDAIINICINAMHAIEGNGEVIIETKNQCLDMFDAEELGIDQGDYVLLSISDTGCGMDDATKEKIFDPFYSTKGEQGTGLGLSQVYGFIGSCNGDVKLYSELGQGTRFMLYFPRDDSDEKNIKKQNIKSTPEIYKGDASILVVDDEPGLLGLTSEILRGQGYTVLTAGSAKQALQILEDEPVDLVLSDVIMPDMDGFELVAIIQENYPDIKIQLASGFTGDHEENLENKRLKNTILQKPYHAQTLLKRVHSLLSL